MNLAIHRDDLGVVANICRSLRPLYLLLSLAADGWWKNKRVIASRKDQVRASLINLTRSNFSKNLISPFEAIRYNFQLPNTLSRSRQQFTIPHILPMNKFQTVPFPLFQTPLLEFLEIYHPRFAIHFPTLLIEINSCTFLSKQAPSRNERPQFHDPKISMRERNQSFSKSKETTEADAFLWSISRGVSGQLAAPAAKATERKQPTPGWAFLHRATAEVSLKGCRWSFDFSA